MLEGVSFSSEVKNVLKKRLIRADEGWEDYVMRYIEVGEDGYSPKHVHP